MKSIEKFFKVWGHPQVQEVVGVMFFIILIFDIAQGLYWKAALDVIIIFCSIQLIRKSK